MTEVRCQHCRHRAQPAFRCEDCGDVHCSSHRTDHGDCPASGYEVADVEAVDQEIEPPDDPIEDRGMSDLDGWPLRFRHSLIALVLFCLGLPGALGPDSAPGITGGLIVVWAVASGIAGAVAMRRWDPESEIAEEYEKSTVRTKVMNRVSILPGVISLFLIAAVWL